MVYQQLSSFVFNCQQCPTPCDGISKLNYIFENDAAFSEHYEQKIIAHINANTSFVASKTTQKGYPDLEIKAKNGGKFYIEVKVQQRTFMQVEKFIPQSGLKPSETVALNLSDFKRYVEIAETEKAPIFILWVLLHRPCILKNESEQYYYRLVSELKPIWLKEGDKRRFRRQTGNGDVVNGIHKGVTVNYHFSLNELKVWQGIF